MFDRLISLTRKEFIQILRDPRTLYMTFMYPLIMLFLFGFAASSDVTNIGLVVFDQDQTAASRHLITAYQNSNYFTLAYVVDSEDQIHALIDTRRARWLAAHRFGRNRIVDRDERYFLEVLGR